MIIKIIAAIIPALCVAWCVFLLCYEPKQKEKTAIAHEWVKPFSVTEYLGRMERESLKLAERREQYLIVLWWGYDGLRLNEDGTTEWISRKPKPAKADAEISLDCSGMARSLYGPLSAARRLDGTIVQSTALDIESAIQAQTQSLQAQQLQILQSIQTQNMINCIRPAQYPAYLSYPSQCCITTYTPNYWTYPGGCFGTHQS